LSDVSGQQNISLRPALHDKMPNVVAKLAILPGRFVFDRPACFSTLH
jgi:hypothetical protein